MLIQRGNREDAIHALMNTWLKMPQRWCLNCEAEFDPVDTRFSCCEEPYYTTNQLVFQHFLKDIEQTRASQKNKFGTSDNNGVSATGMRSILRFPPGLLQFLEVSMKKLYGEKLFTEAHGQRWFARHFGKYFQVPEEV